MLNKNLNKAKVIFKSGFNILVLAVVLLSQISFSGIFLYPGANDGIFTNIAEAADSDSWYSTDWSYRKEITIDHDSVADEDLTDYPFLFSATSDDFKVIIEGGKVGQADGGDIVFTLGDGITKLSHELEDYDSTTGKMDAWVKIPNLSYTVDTKLYIYYGNADVSDQQSKTNVWDANYRMVQHLNETPANDQAGGHLDSTSNAMNGTPSFFYNSALTLNAEGKISGADNFESYIYAPYYWYEPIHYYSRVSLPSSLLGTEESFTLSSWVKSDTPGAVLSNNGGEVDYCGVSGYAYYAFYLQRVVFNTISNSSTTYTDNAYTDYTNVSTTLQAGQTYTLTTTNAPYMHHSIKVWFDFNQDGDFSDSGEEFLVTGESSYQIGHSISVTIPATALNGSTRMRVRAMYNGYNWGGGVMPHACGYEDYSETEDYTVVIQGSAYDKENNTFTFGSFNTGKFSVIKDGIAYDVVGDTNLNDSSWHYLSATYGTEGMKLYVDGVLKGTNSGISGSLSPLRSGFWIGRYYDDRSGQYGFDGTIDEVRVSTSARNANWIQTEYNNQNSPGTFFALSGNEARIMDHFDLAASLAEITSDESLSLTIRAINNMGEDFVSYTGDKTLVFAGAAGTTSSFPTATDKDGNKINFGGNTVLNFVNGVATTTLTLYKDETADIRVSDGTYDEDSSLSILVRPHGIAFVPPSKPVISQVEILRGVDGSINLRNLPESIVQVAISSTADFQEASWENVKGLEDILEKYGEADKFYIKFRTEKGGVSDAMIIERNTSASSGDTGVSETGDVQSVFEGDIVKTADSFDVYIIKYKGGKRFKRLILSPLVFKSYGHLKWENLKIISTEEIDSFITSNLVQVSGEAEIYMLYPDGDMGGRVILDTSNSYDTDSVYEINAIDRDSYKLRE